MLANVVLDDIFQKSLNYKEKTMTPKIKDVTITNRPDSSSSSDSDNDRKKKIMPKRKDIKKMQQNTEDYLAMIFTFDKKKRSQHLGRVQLGY